ncbi:MAG: phosphoenolpyruvate hydrolase family protein [Christensenellales bacterium]|jgi:predicted TIM-barrel enzyme
MAKRYTRAQIIERLRSQIDAGRPLFVPNCGCGLTAKLQEMGGADFICVSPTSYWRMKGQASINAFLPHGKPNEAIFELLPEIVAVVQDTPVITLSNPRDPRLPHREHLEQLQRFGVSGINPLMGKSYGPGFNRRLDRYALGWDAELEFIRAAREMDMFTFAYAYGPDESCILAEAGADMISAHLGQTVGGLVGAESKLTLDEAVQFSQSIFDAARKVNPEVILLTHGGPLTTPEDVQYVHKRTNADGFVGGSAAERLPIEKVIIEATESFKNYTR